LQTLKCIKLTYRGSQYAGSTDVTRGQTYRQYGNIRSVTVGFRERKLSET